MPKLLSAECGITVERGLETGVQGRSRLVKAGQSKWQETEDEEDDEDEADSLARLGQSRLVKANAECGTRSAEWLAHTEYAHELSRGGDPYWAAGKFLVPVGPTHGPLNRSSRRKEALTSGTDIHHGTKFEPPHVGCYKVQGKEFVRRRWLGLCGGCENGRAISGRQGCRPLRQARMPTATGEARLRFARRWCA
jgi:hypothetical protein